MKTLFKVLLFALFSVNAYTAAADVYHSNGYSRAKLGTERLKYDDPNSIIAKIIAAYGGSFEKFENREDRPKLSKVGDAPVAFILRDPGRVINGSPARERITITIFNQTLPKALVDLAIEKFGASESDFVSFSSGFVFNARKKKSGSYSASAMVYRKEPKRQGNPDTVDLGEGTQLVMPGTVRKVITKPLKRETGVSYTLYGGGEIAELFAGLKSNLEGNGFEVSGQSDDESGQITFVKDATSGSISLQQTSSEPPFANVGIQLLTQTCQSKYGEFSVPAPNVNLECE